MGHYKSNLRDIEFNLFEVLGRDKLYGTGPFEEMDLETAKSVLEELTRLAENELAESFTDADRNPPVFDPETNTAPVPASFKKSYQAFMDSEYWRLGVSEAIGGTTAPPSLIWSYAELILAPTRPCGCTRPAPPSPGSCTTRATTPRRRWPR